MASLPQSELEAVCPFCEGRGMRIVADANGRNVAQPCVCRRDARNRRVLQQARIPRRYEHCTLESFETKFLNADKSLFKAKGLAERFVNDYHPVLTDNHNDGRGLLLTGTIGVGKTHLAVGVLHALLTKRGRTGIFYDYRELLKEVQNSYNSRVSVTELEVLAPVFNAEILVLDEIGASKPTDWVWDTVAHILNTRYNDRRTTILTTNYPNLPPLGMANSEAAEGQPPSPMRDETLGDRIGERMRSRLQEMCSVIQMSGEDRRQTRKRAPQLHATRTYKVLSAVHIKEFHLPPGSTIDLGEEDAEDYLRQGKLKLQS